MKNSFRNYNIRERATQSHTTTQTRVPTQSATPLHRQNASKYFGAQAMWADRAKDVLHTPNRGSDPTNREYNMRSAPT